MISVCIPTYNGGKYISQQLESILSQLSLSDQVIISDDGSTDNTLTVVSKLNDSRIEVYNHQPEPIPYNGVFATMYRINRNMNNALKYVKGDYVFFADQDDIWVEGKVERMLVELKKTDCVVHNCIVVDADMKIIVDSFFDIIAPHNTLVQNMIRSNFMGCCMAFNRKVLLLSYPIIDLPVEHDTWVGLCALKKGKVNIIDDRLILYRRHGFNVSSCSDGSRNSLWIKVKRRCYMVLAYFRA